MSTQIESEAPPLALPRTKRVAGIVRWAARITSVPVFALDLISLLPALASFSISAKDDKLIAVGLAAVCAGLLVGWRWAGCGGGLVLVGVGVILSQQESLSYADPFAVAFGLQGVLFLISAALNAAPSKSSASGWPGIRPALIALLVICATAGAVMIYRGPGPIPLGKERQTFVGVWTGGNGFTLEIGEDGRAKVALSPEAKVEACNNPLLHKAEGSFLVYFHGEDQLELTTGPLGSSKIFHVDRHPHADGKQVKMTLNGSDPYQRSQGMVLVKKPAN